MAANAKAITLQEIQIDCLAEARRKTDTLFKILRADSLYERPIPERHRIIFYLGHLEAFDWNLFRGQIPSLEPFAPDLDKLFAFGIDPVGGGLPAEGPEAWPAVETTVGYDAQVRKEIDAALRRDEAGHGETGTPTETLCHVAVEHRLMHAETLAYMFHQLPLERKIPQTQTTFAGVTRENQMVRIPPGTTTLGLRRSGASRFGWDNEFDAFEVEVPAFEIQKYMVTNGEFLSFLEAGGYYNPSLWSAEGWEWKESRHLQHPAFWRRNDEEWLYRGMFEEMDLPLEWPVYVSHAEASAYARWSGKALPTEAEWHRAAYGTPDGRERDYPWGAEAPNQRLGNFDFSRWDPAPVNAFPSNASAWGVVGQLGNGWEWTSSQFAPFKGFRAFPFYPGYSADFFDGKHYVMKGGSPRTAAPLLRRSFRNWFQPHYQYVYAGFRCVSR
jgi:gamma-glutamyl hercynylcysteine S-oxide synthase